jgi:hypothetical protein
MRLIDADALKTALEKCAFMAAGTASLMQADTVLATLDEAPTICCERCVFLMGLTQRRNHQSVALLRFKLQGRPMRELLVWLWLMFWQGVHEVAYRMGAECDVER